MNIRKKSDKEIFDNLTRGECYCDGFFCDKIDHDYLHYGTLNGFLSHID